MHARYCNLVMVVGLVNLRMRGHHGGMRGAQLRPSSLEISAGSKTRKYLGHAMLASSYHRGRKVMRAGDNVGDDLGFRGIRDGRLQYANDGGGAAAFKAAKLDHFPDHAAVRM